MNQALPFFRSSSRQISNDPNRFQGDGVIFRAKLIGVSEVAELKGDRMCFDSMQKLKLEVLRRGEHKQRIFVGVSLDGVKIRKNDGDRMDQEIMYHHEVRCISFIWRDPTDARAMGYVTAMTADAKKHFIAIKTERAADQVITSLKDLFQAIIEKRNQNGTTAQMDAPTPLSSVEEDAVVAKAATVAAAAPPSMPPPPVPAPAADNNLLDWDASEPAAPPAAPPAAATARKQENLFDMFMDPTPEPSFTNAAAPAKVPTNDMKTSQDLSDMFGGAYSPQTSYQASNFDVFSPSAVPAGGAAMGFSWDGPPTPSTSSNPLFDAPSNQSASLFNAPSNTAASLFDTPSNQGGSLFNAPSMPSGSLFDAPIGSGGSLFDSAPMGSSQSFGAPATMGNKSSLFDAASGAPPAVPPRSLPSGSVNPFFNSAMPTLPAGQAQAQIGASNAGFGGLGMGAAGIGGPAPGPASASAFSSSFNPAFGSAAAPTSAFGSAAPAQSASSAFGDIMGMGSSFQSQTQTANPFGAAAPTNTGWGAPAQAANAAANPFASSAPPAAAAAQSSMSNPFFSGPKKEQTSSLFDDLMTAGKGMYAGGADASKPKPAPAPAERGKALYELAQAPQPAPAPAPPATSQTFGQDSTFNMGSAFSGGSLMD